MSVNINHQTNNVQVGAALTLGHTQGLQYHTQSLHTDGFEVNNINASGIVTAGIVTANTIEVSGISTFRNEIEIYRPNNSIYSYTFLDFTAGTGAADRVGGISIYNNTLTLGAQDCDLRLSGDSGYDTVITTTGVNGSYTGSTGRTAVFTSDGTAQLWYQDVKKFETTGSGVKVTGIATATGFSTTTGTSSQFLKADGSVDSSTYLTHESNDLSSAVTWANVPNANITQGSVTQHQAALSITESQISDLQSYLTSYTETQTLNDVLGLGNTSSTGLSVGVVTATSFIKSGGTSSQYLMADGSVTTSGGGGSTTRSVNRYVATANQTLFPASGTISYTVGYVDVFLNGTKLDSTEFTASNGTTVTLATGATVDDIVELVAYTNVNITSVYNPWVDDAVGINTTSSVGIGTTANSTYELDVLGDIRSTGIITAANFYGDGSNLTGVSSEAFKTIAVSGQSDVVADGAADTLTIVAGSNMTITTNASGDSITFASSGGGNFNELDATLFS